VSPPRRTMRKPARSKPAEFVDSHPNSHSIARDSHMAGWRAPT
jgi:hypothetical protein